MDLNSLKVFRDVVSVRVDILRRIVKQGSLGRH